MPIVRVFQASIVCEVEADDYVSAELKNKVSAIIEERTQKELEQIEAELSTPGFSVGFNLGELE